MTDGPQLTWEMNVQFNGPSDQDFDGRSVFVGEGSTVRFLNDLTMNDVSIVSATDPDSNYDQFDLSGGCIYTDGYFRVDGTATFYNCQVWGAGESAPGPGCVLYVEKEVSVPFNGALQMSDTSIIDDYGGYGGGIFNKGKVEINGNAKFESLRARDGGAIYNAVDGEFRFKKQANAIFIDCTSHDGTGSALYNAG